VVETQVEDQLTEAALVDLTTVIQAEVQDILEVQTAIINLVTTDQVLETHIVMVITKATIINQQETPIQDQNLVVLLVAINHRVEIPTVNQKATVILAEVVLEQGLVIAIRTEEKAAEVHQNLHQTTTTLTEAETRIIADTRDRNLILDQVDIIEAIVVQEAIADLITDLILRNQEVEDTITLLEAQTDHTVEVAVALEEAAVTLDHLEVEVHQDQLEAEVTADQDSLT